MNANKGKMMKKLLLLSLLAMNAHAGIFVKSTAHEFTEKVHKVACETGFHDFTIVNDSNLTAYYLLTYYTEMPFAKTQYQTKEIWLAPGVLFSQHFTSSACHAIRAYGDYKTHVYSIAQGNGQIVSNVDSATVHIVS